jgi:gamma-glutamyltranspeptidase/glutathione hydrolase
MGSMGGDAQPQFLLQLLARTLHHGQDPGTALDAGRWTLDAGGFRMWEDGGPGRIIVEAHAPAAWDAGLRERGHEVERRTAAVDLAFGQAQMISVDADGVLDAAADARAATSAATGY